MAHSPRPPFLVYGVLSLHCQSSLFLQQKHKNVTLWWIHTQSRYRSIKNCSSMRRFAEFSIKDLVNKDGIGRGGFSSVFAAEFLPSREKVAVKKFLDGEADRRILLKEAKLLNSLQHPHIVGFKGVLLEFLEFDFTPFGIDLKVNPLADLLRRFDKTDCRNINKKVFYKISENVASSLHYLNKNGLAHSDLKPANVWVSNHHYCQLSNPENIDRICSSRPLP